MSLSPIKMIILGSVNRSGRAWLFFGPLVLFWLGALFPGPAWGGVDRADIVSFGVYAEPRRVPARKAGREGCPPVTLRLAQKTDQIQARLLLRFGFEFVLRGTARTAPVKLTIRVAHPEIVDPFTGQARQESVSEILGCVGRKGYAGWGFLSDWEIRPGSWKIDLMHEGKVLASKTFHVTEGSAEAPLGLGYALGPVRIVGAPPAPAEEEMNATRAGGEEALDGAPRLEDKAAPVKEEAGPLSGDSAAGMRPGAVAGLFKMEDQARELVKGLKAKGIPAMVHPLVNRLGGWFAVRLLEFPDMFELRRAARKRGGGAAVGQAASRAPQAASQTEFMIQAASFKKRASAEEYAAALVKRGRKALVFASSDGAVFAVRIRGYKDRAEAVTEAEILSAEEGRPVYVLEQGANREGRLGGTPRLIGSKKPSRPKPGRTESGPRPSLYLELASFPVESEAERYADKLRQAGYAPAIQARTDKNPVWYAVRLGPYSNEVKARQAAANFRNDLERKALINKGVPRQAVEEEEAAKKQPAKVGKKKKSRARKKGGEAGYCVQVGAVKSESAASRYVQALKDKGYGDARLVPMSSDLGQWFAVRFGNFTDKGEAEKAARDYESKEKGRASVVESPGKAGK